MENKSVANSRSARSRPVTAAVWLAIALAAAHCGGGTPEPTDEAASEAEALETRVEAELERDRSELSADARIDTFATLVADRDAPRSPADGGGRAWIEWPGGEPSSPPAASPGRFEIVYEAGPLGVAEGGAVYLQPSPFWDWDAPQTRVAEGPGYTTVSTDASGVALQTDDASGAFLVVTIDGRPLAPGERLRFVYGEGRYGARVDRFHEDRSPLYVAVDGDGDGVRAVIDDVPRIDVASRGPGQLSLIAPSTAKPGEAIELTVAALDALGSPARVESGGVVWVDLPEGAQAASPVDLSGDHFGHRRISVSGWPPGTHRVGVRGTGELEGLEAISNPIQDRKSVV